MKIYIAASFPRRKEARQLALLLIAAGHTIVSAWVWEEGPDYFDLPEAQRTQTAHRDSHQVAEADILVQLTGDTQSRGGRHSELGMVITWNDMGIMVPIVLQGPREQVFHYHLAVRAVLDFPAQVVAAVDTLETQLNDGTLLDAMLADNSGTVAKETP